MGPEWQRGRREGGRKGEPVLATAPPKQMAPVLGSASPQMGSCSLRVERCLGGSPLAIQLSRCMSLVGTSQCRHKRLWVLTGQSVGREGAGLGGGCSWLTSPGRSWSWHSVRRQGKPEWVPNRARPWRGGLGDLRGPQQWTLGDSRVERGGATLGKVPGFGGTWQGPWIWAVWKQDWKGGWVVGLSPLEWTGGRDV